MAGTLGRVDLLEPAALEEAHRLQVTPDATLAVQQMGIPAPTAPYGYTGEMPPDITSLDDDELGDLLNKVGQWVSFLDYKLSMADSERSSANAALEFTRARVRIALKVNASSTREGKLTADDKKDIMNTDPRVLEAWSRDLYCESVYQILKSLRNKAQNSWDTVSRRITQRGQEVERMRREGSVAGVPATQGRVFNRRQST